MTLQDENNIKKISVANILALFHILDDYDEFNDNLKTFISSKDNTKDVLNLSRISNGKNVVGAKKVKKFYQENKDVIDEINEYSSIDAFIYDNYDIIGNLRDDSCVDFFKNYLTIHNKEKDKIHSLLVKINTLGFKDLFLDENSDFSDSIYGVYNNFNGVFDFVYMENMEALPNYRNDIVKYKTTKSNYKLILNRMFGQISKFDRKIVVNSLLFDPNSLPDKITKESTFDDIINLKNNEKDNCIAIQNSVKLSVSVDELNDQFDSTSRVIDRLDNIENKEQLKQTLLKIKENINELKTISDKYDESISKEDSHITKAILKKEKKDYIQREY